MKQIQQLTPEEHEMVTNAVAEAERETDGEIVTIVTPLSDKYHDAGLHWALAFTFFYLGSIAVAPAFYQRFLLWLSGGWDHDYNISEQLGVVFVSTVIVFLIGRYLFAYMPLRLFLTPKATKARRVRRRAIDFFKVGAERRTMGLTGILIYMSMGEHRAEIVAEEAILAKVEPEVWGDAMAALVDHVRQGQPGQGMAEAVRHVGIVLKEHFPKSQDNPNELPDRLIEL
ncbi:TPM domain-containing protein [Parasphingorhabdus sp. DH2-15]|uniref:TPM domain-containing protein n=1 Tax=Parasphingorhabdus sp. DH2-15 TaxID=3444112 RepID=UPI003F68220B